MDSYLKVLKAYMYGSWYYVCTLSQFMGIGVSCCILPPTGQSVYVKDFLHQFCDYVPSPSTYETYKVQSGKKININKG